MVRTITIPTKNQAAVLRGHHQTAVFLCVRCFRRRPAATPTNATSQQRDCALPSLFFSSKRIALPSHSVALAPFAMSSRRQNCGVKRRNGVVFPHDAGLPCVEETAEAVVSFHHQKIFRAGPSSVLSTKVSAATAGRFQHFQWPLSVLSIIKCTKAFYTTEHTHHSRHTNS